MSTSLPLSRLLAPSQSISRLQSTGNDVTGSLQDTCYWQEGGGHAPFLAPLQMLWRRSRMVSHLRDGFVPGSDWCRKKGRALRGVPGGGGCFLLRRGPTLMAGFRGKLGRRNELMGVLWVERIIFPFFLFAQNLGDGLNGDYLSEALIENSRVGARERIFFISYIMKEWLEGILKRINLKKL